MQQYCDKALRTYDKDLGAYVTQIRNWFMQAFEYSNRNLHFERRFPAIVRPLAQIVRPTR
jgi:hypothetical protein